MLLYQGSYIEVGVYHIFIPSRLRLTIIRAACYKISMEKEPVKYFQWEPGRQNKDGTVGYEKMRLWQLFNRTDGYFLRYQPGYELPPHRDPVKDHRHFRLNIILRGDGAFYAEKTLVNLWNRVVLFRPDQATHGVHAGKKPRTVFSVGLVLKA